MTNSTPANYYSVEEACEKQLRDHELPSTIEGFLIVTESFSYLVDDLSWDQGNGKQPSVLLLDASIAERLAEHEELEECFGGVGLYHEWVEVTGILRASGIGAFERQLYRIDSLTVLTENDDESVNSIAISLP
jgi:hypothetical protein